MKKDIQTFIRKASIADAEAISSIWEVICSERKFSAVIKPFTPQQEREYISSLSDREGIFIAELEKQIIAFQSLDLWAKFTDSFDHVGTIGSLSCASLYFWISQKIILIHLMILNQLTIQR